MFLKMLQALFVLVLVACGPKYEVQENLLDGHFENSSAAELEAVKGSQTLVPEYHVNQNHMISLPLLNEYDQENLAASILKAGKNKLFLAVPKSLPTDIAAGAYSDLRKVVGENSKRVQPFHPLKHSGSQLSVWTRDWAPLSAHNKDDELVLLDLNYYVERPQDDAIPTAIASVLGRKRISIPIYNEGGNFMSDDDGFCFMAEGIVESNAEKQIPSDMILEQEDLQQMLIDYAGCKEVVVLPALPYEGTGHIDIWVKLVSNDTVIIADLSDETIATMPQHERSKAVEVQSFLKERQADFTDMGYVVKKLPMPAPYVGSDMFRSYINGLTVDGTYISPRYQKGVNALGWPFSYWDEALLPEYENQVRQVLSEVGYAVDFVTADNLIRDGGAVHCVTMQF